MLAFVAAIRTIHGTLSHAGDDQQALTRLLLLIGWGTFMRRGCTKSLFLEDESNSEQAVMLKTRPALYPTGAPFDI